MTVSQYRVVTQSLTTRTYLVEAESEEAASLEILNTDKDPETEREGNEEIMRVEKI